MKSVPLSLGRWRLNLDQVFGSGVGPACADFEAASKDGNKFPLILSACENSGETWGAVNWNDESGA